MNRSNSLVNALKWWPLQGHTQSATDGSNGGNNQQNQQQQHQQFHHFSNGNCNNNHILHHNKTVSFGSSVAVQKLRESKWFKSEEQKIFCAVVECGFIVEVRNRSNNNSNGSPYNHRLIHGVDDDNDDDDDDDDDDDNNEVNTFNACAGHNGLLHQDENETPVISWFGVVICKTTKDNKPKPETIEIFSVKIRENGTFKMIKMSLENIWAHNYELRINNFADKEKQPHIEKDIKNQVSFARKAKQSLWNNSKHFAYWCRYGSRQQDVRKRQMSECVKWGSVGMNAGMLLVMSKQKSYSSSK